MFEKRKLEQRALALENDGSVALNELRNGEKLSIRNLLMFALGTFGRDFLYALFANYILSYILFTKTLTDAQFASVSIIIIVARIFDAFNDPIMGGIVENTRSKWGKFKPWQLIGCISTAAVIVVVFSTTLQGWAFIGIFAFLYFMFSITFTMNDISYWGMMPSLTSNEHDRSKLMSLAQLVASGGGGLVGLLIPILTAGKWALNGSANAGYMIMGILAGALMIAFQLFTIIGVKEKPLPADFVKTPRMKIRQMFKVIFKNDQLLWCTLVMIIYCVSTGVVGGGLSMTYIYFEFGYDGGLLTLFGIALAVTSTLFTITYPWLSKKFGRNKMLYATGIALVVGHLLLLVCGLALPTGSTIKFVLMTLCNGILGFGYGFYMIMVINIANTVEYNEYKTGKRDEGLIFSIRPFTAKLSSALVQGIVTAVYMAVGVLVYTNKISEFENMAAANPDLGDWKLEQITNVISGIPEEQKIALLVCMCLIPAIFMTIAIIIYKKKCILNEKKHAEIVQELNRRKLAEESVAVLGFNAFEAVNVSEPISEAAAYDIANSADGGDTEEE